MNISIIVPVYNVEKYLDYCLHSILKQQLDEYEVLLIDDCSPDRCGEICDHWAKRDPHFKVTHCEKNLGLSGARNEGIRQATGEYITFIDSDDYIAPNTLKDHLALLSKNKEIDVLEYPIRIYHGAINAELYKPGKGEIVNYTEWIKQKGYLHSYACNKIFKRELWNDIRFPERRLFEDMFTIPRVMERSRNIMRSNKGLYYYCNRKGSISNSVTLQSISELLQANLQLYNASKQLQGLTETELDEMYLHLCNPQIVLAQMGGDICIPNRNIPLKRALLTQRPTKYRIKAILKAICGKRYCQLMARTRKILKR